MSERSNHNEPCPEFLELDCIIPHDWVTDDGEFYECAQCGVKRISEEPKKGQPNARG